MYNILWFISVRYSELSAFDQVILCLVAELKKLKEQEEVLPVPVQETGCSETGGEDSSTCACYDLHVWLHEHII